MAEMDKTQLLGTETKGIKVLVADDIPFGLIYAKKVLSRLNLEVITAVNGQEVLDKALSEKPSLLLLELMLPVIDGYEVIRRLRSDPQLSQSRIIVMSALSTNDNIVRALNLGADDFVVKPIATDKLLKSVLGQIELIRAMEADAKG
ncbi:MAG: response regulator [Bacteroidaceae bacterium]|jgi:CheY-like chemotaxis protein|nr:response regulator [Bacteroidaceae bacterium]